MPGLHGQHPQHVGGVGVTRVDGQDLPIGLLCFLKPSGRMQALTLLQGGIELFGPAAHANYPTPAWSGLTRPPPASVA